jgi:hypothetical protein
MMGIDTKTESGRLVAAVLFIAPWFVIPVVFFLLGRFVVVNLDPYFYTTLCCLLTYRLMFAYQIGSREIWEWSIAGILSFIEASTFWFIGGIIIFTASGGFSNPH